MPVAALYPITERSSHPVDNLVSRYVSVFVAPVGRDGCTNGIRFDVKLGITPVMSEQHIVSIDRHIRYTAVLGWSFLLMERVERWLVAYRPYHRGGATPGLSQIPSSGVYLSCVNGPRRIRQRRVWSRWYQ